MDQERTFVELPCNGNTLQSWPKNLDIKCLFVRVTITTNEYKLREI